MASYGVNVPPGVPVFKLDEVLPAAKKMADDSGQVAIHLLLPACLLRHHISAQQQHDYKSACSNCPLRGDGHRLPLYLLHEPDTH